VADPGRLVDAIECGLRAGGSKARAAGAKRYLKSELEFLGVATPKFRAIVRESLRSCGALEGNKLRAAVRELWGRPVFELRAAAVELLDRHAKRLEPADLAMIEEMLRGSGTWALVDWLATRVAGPLVERHPALAGELDRWATAPDFWLRRAAMLTLLMPMRRGGGDFERFGRYADRMLEEREFFIRKAIGWVLREVGKKRPQVVEDWLRPRLARASGLTVREAVKHLPGERRAALLEEYRGTVRSGRDKRPTSRGISGTET
jgi:3-methyladenine DNA glycosylase AlkD